MDNQMNFSVESDGLVIKDGVTRPITIKAAAGTTLVRGSLASRVWDATNLVPWSEDAVDGSEKPVTVLARTVTVPESGTVNTEGYIRGDLDRRCLMFGTTDAANIENAVWELIGRGVNVR